MGNATMEIVSDVESKYRDAVRRYAAGEQVDGVADVVMLSGRDAKDFANDVANVKRFVCLVEQRSAIGNDIGRRVAEQTAEVQRLQQSADQEAAEILRVAREAVAALQGPVEAAKSVLTSLANEQATYARLGQELGRLADREAIEAETRRISEEVADLRRNSPIGSGDLASAQEDVKQAHAVLDAIAAGQECEFVSQRRNRGFADEYIRREAQVYAQSAERRLASVQAEVERRANANAIIREACDRVNQVITQAATDPAYLRWSRPVRQVA